MGKPLAEEEEEPRLLYALHLAETQESDNNRKEIETAKTSITESDSSTACDAFQFTVERMRHYQGAWHSLTTTIFPQYLFIECGQDEARALQEKQIPLIALSEDASQFLQELFGTQHHIPMSRGIVRNGVAHVTHGPLKGYENRIVKIDRHKRLAWLRIAENVALDLGKESTSTVIAGLEITEKG